MKQLILIAFISIVSTILGIGLTKDPGYILVVFHHWQIETSLFLGGLLLIILSFSAIVSYYFLKDFFSLPFSLLKKFRGWQQYRAEQGLNRGLQAFYQGKWHLAFKNIQTQHQHSTWTTDLIGAEAAQKDNAFSQRDAFILHALENHPEAKESILLFQAKLLLEQGQLEQSQAILRTIAIAFTKPTYQWLLLQLQVHQNLKEYELGLKLVECQKNCFKNEQEYLDQYRLFCIPILKDCLNKKQMDVGLELYKKMPKNLQSNFEILKIIAPHFSELRIIRNQIEKYLSTKIDDNILEIISTLPPSSYWLKKLEKIRDNHEKNAMLYYTFGKIEAGLKLWGSAIADLQKSLQLQPRYQSYTLLAQIYMDLNEPSNALNALQQAIECPAHEQ